jgi:hypothetical protein
MQDRSGPIEEVELCRCAGLSLARMLLVLSTWDVSSVATCNHNPRSRQAGRALTPLPDVVSGQPARQEGLD